MKCDIIYRACGKEVYPDQKRSIRPHWFDKIKCFKSCWDMTVADPTTFRMHIIYDQGVFDGKVFEDSNGVFHQVQNDLLDYIRPMPMYHDGLKLVNHGNYDTIYDAYDYADTLDGDWIYFVEDDYLHTPDAARVFVEGASRFELISLYDHTDRYTRDDDITAGKESLALSPSCHWRTSESTTCTYAISRTEWNKMKGIIRKHGASETFFKEMREATGLMLWTPITGRSTHCYKGYMSPGVDWDAVAEGVKI